MSEPAIQVRRKGKGTQVWTIEKLENKLVDMREHYADWKEDSEEMVRKQQDQNRKVVPKYYSYAPVFGFVCFFPQCKRTNSNCCDPFYEAQENHNLIGVANIFLECLFHDVKLQYAVPIISQQGEVRGRRSPTHKQRSRDGRNTRAPSQRGGSDFDRLQAGCTSS